MASGEYRAKLRMVIKPRAAFIRFYGELNDFLPPDRRGRMCVYRFEVSPSIKEAIESLGVPHPEVELMVVNHEPVDFAYPLQPDDYVSVYPAFHSIQLGTMPKLRPERETPPRFVLDVHLGRLAGYLRLLGFDALYGNRASDPEIARVSSREHRTVLTRDIGLLKRNEVVYGYWVRHTEPRKQLLEIVRHFDLADHAGLFTRCLVCNTPLERAERETIVNRVPERTAVQFRDFHICPGCERVYWKGSHYQRMLHLAGRILRDARA